MRLALRRHPRPVELGAWFDDEGDPAVGDHVTGCVRCLARGRELGRLRGRLRPLARPAEPRDRVGTRA